MDKKENMKDNVYDLFEVQELEQRLEMSQVSQWSIGVKGKNTISASNNQNEIAGYIRMTF